MLEDGKSSTSQITSSFAAAAPHHSVVVPTKDMSEDQKKAIAEARWEKSSTVLLGFVTVDGLRKDIDAMKKFGIHEMVLSSLIANFERFGQFCKAIGDPASPELLHPQKLSPFWFRVAEAILGPYCDKMKTAFVRAFKILPDMLPDQDPDDVGTLDMSEDYRGAQRNYSSEPEPVATSTHRQPRQMSEATGSRFVLPSAASGTYGSSGSLGYTGWGDYRL